MCVYRYRNNLLISFIIIFVALGSKDLFIVVDFYEVDLTRLGLFGASH